MIKASNIYKTFGELHVLKGVDLDIQKGMVASIVGASGAGKTTLLQILGTLDKPDMDKSPSLFINDTDVLTLKDKALSEFRNQKIGFIFQFHQLLPEFTAVENVCIPAYINKSNRGEAEKKAKDLLNYLGLSHRINHKPS